MKQLICTGLIILSISILYQYCDLGAQVHKMEKVLDHLTLDVTAQELTEALDQLEASLEQLPDSVQHSYFIDFTEDGLLLHRLNIDSNQVTLAYLQQQVELTTMFSTTDLRHIVNTFHLLSRNRIQIGAFQVNYHCNHRTFITYRQSLCDNSRYCWRELYFHKDDDFKDSCYKKRFYKVDSLDNIYLLKPKEFKDF